MQKWAILLFITILLIFIPHYIYSHQYPNVALPPPILKTPNVQNDIMENALRVKELSLSVTMLKKTGIWDTLKSSGPYTVFLPTNSAIHAVPKKEWDELGKPENKAKLLSMLMYHVVDGGYTISDLQHFKKIKSVEGDEIVISLENGKVHINNATVVEENGASSNGVLYGTTQLLMLPSREK